MISKAEKRRQHKAQRQAAQEKRCAGKRARHDQKRKQKQYHPYRYLSRNQKEVAKRLLDGEVTMISSASWAFFERFLVFLHQVGFFEVIGVEGKQFYRQMIEVSLLVMTYSAKVLLGIASINQVPGRLFRDTALLLLIGYTSEQLASGFCCRGYTDKQKPMHKNTLADAVEKLSAEEVAYILNEAVKRLAARGVFRSSQGHFALDSTDLETTEHYRGAGKKKVTVRQRLPDGRYVEIEEYLYGFKLVVIYEVHLRLIVAAQVAPIHQHDTNFTRDLLQQAIDNVGAGVIRVLLMDMGFLDGEMLWRIKHTYHIDFVVPSKDNMRVTREARSFRERKADGEYLFRDERPGDGPKQKGYLCLFGVKEVTAYDQYGDAEHQKRLNRKDFQPNPINAIVVQAWDCHTYRPAEEKVFLTLVMFTLTNAYRTDIGQELAQAGIRRQRLAWQDANKVLVLAGDYYAIFDLEELLIILGCEPQICWRVDPLDVRKRYGLPDPPRA